jgi:crotonobetainyl-CoA:carnitine CoA-transferase CaiB-like acyl-CoA transferase
MKKLNSVKELIILDVSTVLAGPSVGMFFAELGAKVIKIEHPSQADVTRSWKLPSENNASPVSAYFSSVNYGKSYLQLDLSNENQHASFLELVRTADVVISNFKKGDDQKLHLETSFLHSINPKLIIGKISGFGSESDRVAYDLILQAESGFMSMNGTKDSGPVKMPVALIDVLAGHQLKEGILLALMERQLSGKGSEVTVSLYDAAVCSLANQASNYLMTGHIAERLGSLHPNIAPYGELFTTKDQTLVTFAIGSNAHFKKLTMTLGLPEIALDERFVNNQNRLKNRTELENILQQAISKMESTTLLSDLNQQHVPCAKVKTLDEVFMDEKARNLVLSETIEGIDTKRVQSIAFKLKDDSQS